MVEEPSLQALLDISNHPTLSKRLTEVIISTTQYGESSELASTTAQRLLLGGYAPYSIFNSSGEARDMLVEAFRKVSFLLRSLKPIGLTIPTAAKSPQGRAPRLRRARKVPRWRQCILEKLRSFIHGRRTVCQQRTKSALGDPSAGGSSFRSAGP